jgi:hypothetical protein
LERFRKPATTSPLARVTFEAWPAGIAWPLAAGLAGRARSARNTPTGPNRRISSCGRSCAGRTRAMLRSTNQPDRVEVKRSFQIPEPRSWSASRHSSTQSSQQEDRRQPGAWRLRTHSSGSPALRKPSDIHGKFGSSSRINLTVSFGFARRASARVAFASGSFPSKA